MQKYYFYLITLFSIFLICLLIELVAADSLQRSSSDYIYSLQSGWTQGSKNFFIIIANGTEYIAMGLGFLYYLASKTKKSIICICLTFTATWVGDVLKMIIAHPRPFWFDSRIEALSCSKDYGSPSGHALTVGTIIIYIYSKTYHKNKYISTFLTAASLGLLALDRNYLGVHFYFQVVLGYSLASFLVYGSLDSKIWVTLKRCSRELKSLVILNVACLVLLLFGVMVYFVRDPEMKGKWTDNYKDGCSGDLDSEIALFQSLSESSCLMIIAGFITGLYFNKTKKVNSLKYIIVSIVVFLCGAAFEVVGEVFYQKLSRPGCFVLFCSGRYFIGFYISYIVPLLLSLCFKGRQYDNEMEI